MPASRSTRAPRRAAARLPVRAPVSLVERLLDTPEPARAIPALTAEQLHRIIGRCGLDACGPLLALATPRQLADVLDLDVWRAPAGGADERFDARRFLAWLEALLETGSEPTARVLSAIDASLIAAAVASHARTFDLSVVTPIATTDGGDTVGARLPVDAPTHEIGGYVLVARDGEGWDSIVAALTALEEHEGDCFRDVMQACRSLSHAPREQDGLHDLLDDRDQRLFDQGGARDERRWTRGFLKPAQARAFLAAARQVRVDARDPPGRDPLVQAFLREHRPPDAEASTPAALPEISGATDPDSPPSDPVTPVIDVLVDAGVIPPPRRGQLGRPQELVGRAAYLEDYLQSMAGGDPSSCTQAQDELTFLANVLVSGCALQGRAFTPQEAIDGAAAVCNLGLEHWMRHWPHDAASPVAAFQVGWAILHDDVVMYAAAELVRVLRGVSDPDRETGIELERLRRHLLQQLRAGTPWRARDRLDVLATLDMTAWAGVSALIDEFPVLHAAIGALRATSRPHTVDPFAFDFISTGEQIALVRAFLETLAELLGSA